MKPSFFTRRSLAIILVTVFLVPIITRGTRFTLRSNRNDVVDWLPKEFPETAVHRWYNTNFPHEQFVLISWKGCTLHDAPGDDRFNVFVKKLQTPPAKVSDDDPWYFNEVISGRSLVAQLQERYGLDEDEAIRRLEGSLIGPDGESTCVIVTLNEAAKGKNLRPTLEKIHTLARESGIDPPEKESEGLFADLFNGATGIVGDLIFGRQVSEDGIRMGGPPVDNVAIDVEGECTLYRLAGLSAIVGFSIAWLVFRSIRLTLMVFFVGILAVGVGLASVFYSGGSCDAILLSMPSLVYVLAMSGSIHIVNYYRDAIHDSGKIGAPGRAISLGWRPCTIASGTTAIGLGSLCASHVIPISKFGIYSAWAVIATLALIFLLLPAMLHYYDLIGRIMRAVVKRLVPIRGVAAYADARINRPLVVQREPGEVDNTLLARWWRAVGGVIIRHNVVVSIGCLGVMAFFLVGVNQLGFSFKLMKLFSDDAQIIADYRYLEKQIGPLVPMEVVIHVDNQKCQLTPVERMRLAQGVERVIERFDEVGGALSAATMAPDIKPIVRWGANINDAQLNKVIEKYRPEFREYLTVDKDYAVATEKTYATLRELGIRDELAKPLANVELNTWTAINEYVGKESIRKGLQTVEGIDAKGAEEIAQAIGQWQEDHRDPTIEELGITGRLARRLTERKLTTLLAIERLAAEENETVVANLQSIRDIDASQAADVAEAIDQWRTANGRELWRISARVEALNDDLDYADFVHELRAELEPLLADFREKDPANRRGIEATYTGLVPLIYKTQHALMDGLINSLAMAFVLIALVMMVVLKSPSAGLLSMIPNLFPIVVIFGIMGWTGILVDIGSMMAASVALGVAVDDTIHYLTWFRRGLDQGLDRKGAVMLAYERCGTAMTQTTLIGGLGLAVFAFSTFTPTQRLGVLMLTLLTAALFGDLIFLPAVLSGPIGRVFAKSKKKRDDRLIGDETGIVSEAAAGPSARRSPMTSKRQDSSHRSKRVP